MRVGARWGCGRGCPGAGRLRAAEERLSECLSPAFGRSSARGTGVCAVNHSGRDTLGA